MPSVICSRGLPKCSISSPAVIPFSVRWPWSSVAAAGAAGELIEHFGKPRLQITEGIGTKLQFAGPACVLDAYLYPPGNGGGTPRVTEIDARNFQGTDVNPQSCVYAIEQGKRR